MKTHSTWLAAGLLAMAVLGCNYSSSGGYKTSDLHMAKDDGNEQPGAEAKAFRPNDHTIHCVGKLSDAKAGTKITFTWTAVDTPGAKNEQIKQLDYTTKGEENIIHSNLSLSSDWPKGKYKCALTINGAADRSVEYTVE